MFTFQSNFLRSSNLFVPQTSNIMCTLLYRISRTLINPHTKVACSPLIVVTTYPLPLSVSRAPYSSLIALLHAYPINGRIALTPNIIIINIIVVPSMLERIRRTPNHVIIIHKCVCTVLSSNRRSEKLPSNTHTNFTNRNRIRS